MKKVQLQDTRFLIVLHRSRFSPSPFSLQPLAVLASALDRSLIYNTTTNKARDDPALVGHWGLGHYSGKQFL